MSFRRTVRIPRAGEGEKVADAPEETGATLKCYKALTIAFRYHFIA
jgi:hypothetical protein